MGEENAASVSTGKLKMVKLKYTSLWKTYNILSSERDFPKHNYTFRIYATKVVSLMHHLGEKLQLKAGRLRNVTIVGHNFNILPVYDCGGKALEGMFKTYKYSLPEDEDPVGEPKFNDIVKLLTMRGESKAVLSTYYIKFRHDKTVFDSMLGNIR